MNRNLQEHTKLISFFRVDFGHSEKKKSKFPILGASSIALFMRKISADFIFPISKTPIKDGVIILEEDGTILKIEERSQHDLANLEIHKGIICPGFINTHCHMELSHMKGRVNTGTGLIPFISDVVAYREVPMEEILDAIEKADQEMYEAGIVAVGDISNKLDTAAQKNKSKINYYSFVEMFDFLQSDNAQATFDQYKEVYDGQSNSNGNKKSCVPHAPYTVSPELFGLMNAVNSDGQTISIHNQESPYENALFQEKTGGFVDFYNSFGIPIDNFEAIGKTSIHYALEHMNPDCRTLFVHNTMTQEADIRAAQDWSTNTYWATCANANLYIENRMPDYRHFIETNARLTIGTDSLTSNWQLSVLEELKTISRYQSYVPFETLLRWATLNGAAALGYEDSLGSLEKGKKPGINLISGVDEEFTLSKDATVKRLI